MPHPPTLLSQESCHSLPFVPSEPGHTDPKTARFCSVLDQGLSDLRRCIVHEFVNHVKHVIVSGYENGCDSLVCAPSNSLLADSETDYAHTFERYSMVSDDTDRGDKGRNRCDGRQDAPVPPPQSRQSSKLSKLSFEHASRSSPASVEDLQKEKNSNHWMPASSNNSRGSTIESPPDNAGSAGEISMNPVHSFGLESCTFIDSRWARFVQLIVKLGRGSFTILPCWTPATDDPVLQSVLESNLIPVGHMSQQVDEIWHVWNAVHQKGIPVPFFRMASQSTDSVPQSVLPMRSGGGSKRKRQFVIHPLSTRRILWCSIGLLGIGYDAFMISLSVFDLKANNISDACDWILRVYWLLDIAVSFRTGFYVKNIYHNAPLEVARNYMLTWLPFDLLAVAPDWIITLLEDSSDVGEYSQTFRYLKIFKILRLVRIAKMAVWLREIIDSVNSINLALSVHMAKYSLMVFVWVHFCATCWYGVAKNAEDSWISRHKLQHMELPQSYFLSLQWAFAQLQGSSDISGSDTASERALHAAVVMVSIFVLAIFISNITNNLIQLQTAWDRKARHLRALQDYLHRHRVSPDLAESVRKYCEEKLRIERKLQFGEDDVTKMLPKALRRSLLVEVRAQMIIQTSSIFLTLSRYLPKTFEKLCCDLITPYFSGPDIMVFNYSEECNLTYFNVAGQLVYDHVNNGALGNFVKHLQSQATSFGGKPSADALPRFSQPRSSTSDTMAPQSNHDKLYMKERLHQRDNIVEPYKLDKCQPICEAALWTRWSHCGDLTAISHMAFLTLEDKAFSIMVENDTTLQKLGVAHAVRFCRVANHMEISDLTTSNEILDSLHKAGELEATPMSESPFMVRMPSLV